MPRQEAVTFESDGLRLSGIVHIPDDLKAGEQRPAFLVLHGFGTNKLSVSEIAPLSKLTPLVKAVGEVPERFHSPPPSIVRIRRVGVESDMLTTSPSTAWDSQVVATRKMHNGSAIRAKQEGENIVRDV